MNTKYIQGDYVKYNSQIVCINEAFETDCFVMPSGKVADYEDLYPIPLTHAILEKNGWKKDRDNYRDCNHHLMLCKKSNGYAFYKVVNGNIIWLTNIKYVHQLQHILWALDLNSEMKV